MMLKKHLEGLKRVRGFAAVGLFTPEGEMLDSVTQGSFVDASKAALIGASINDVLLSAQEMAAMLQLGNSSSLYITSKSGALIVQAYNKDGKHFHGVLYLEPGGNDNMGKIELKRKMEAASVEF